MQQKQYKGFQPGNILDIGLIRHGIQNVYILYA